MRLLDREGGRNHAIWDIVLLSRDPGPVYASYMSRWNSRADAAALPRMLYADQKTYLVELLMKQDQMSLACSI